MIVGESFGSLAELAACTSGADFGGEVMTNGALGRDSGFTRSTGVGAFTTGVRMIWGVPPRAMMTSSGFRFSGGNLLRA